MVDPPDLEKERKYFDHVYFFRAHILRRKITHFGKEKKKLNLNIIFKVKVYKVYLH